jgi:thymidylate synthase (FAD)
MRAEVKRRFPELAVQLQPKCGEARLGYCDEAFKDWQACPIGRKRPHKSTLFDLYARAQSGALAELGDADFALIEREQTDDAEPY